MPQQSIQTTEDTPPKMTYEAFLEWADEDTHAEWVDGEVIVLSPISNRHQRVGGFLLSLIQHYVERHDLGTVLYEPFQMKIAPDLPGRSPDLIFVSKARSIHLKDHYLDGPADLAVEIISPESRARDRGDKFYEYEQGGVQEYWLIDPIRKQAEFYGLGEDGIYRLLPIDEAGIFHSPLLEDLWLEVDWLWQDPMPKLLSVLKLWKLI